MKNVRFSKSMVVFEDMEEVESESIALPSALEEKKARLSTQLAVVDTAITKILKRNHQSSMKRAARKYFLLKTKIVSYFSCSISGKIFSYHFK